MDRTLPSHRAGGITGTFPVNAVIIRVSTTEGDRMGGGAHIRAAAALH